MSRSFHLAMALIVPLAAAGAVFADDLPQAGLTQGSLPTPVDKTAATATSANDVASGANVPPKVEPVTAAVETVPATPPVTAPVTAPVVKADIATTPAAFALLTELDERLKTDKATGVAREDRDAAVKFYASRSGTPLWVTEGGLTPRADALIAEIGKAGDYGLDAAAFKLPSAPASGAARADLADAEATLTLAALKYARHARGGRMDPMALSSAIDRKAQLLPPAQVLEQLAAADHPDAALRGFQPTNPQFEKLRQKWLAVRAGEQVLDTPPVDAVADEPAKGKKKVVVAPRKQLTPAELERKLLVNMEMWRWMPTLGDYYIQPNIPDFTVRVVKDGHVIHSERIVTGQPGKMTPIFSDEMRLVVFKPYWNVPESIKYNEMLPQLMRGASLEKSGYRAEINGHVADPGSVDWNEVDLRAVHIYQPPGEGNALGRVKFLFPNKHDVYLHDTPAKSLFNSSSRAFSHGCVRVRDPLKLAEVILSADKGWTRAQVDKQASSGPENTEIKLTHPIPIHITYFTAWVDDAGKLQTAADVYGHENRVHLGIEGKANLIAHDAHEPSFTGPSREDRRRYAEQKHGKQSDPIGQWFKNMFN